MKIAVLNTKLMYFSSTIQVRIKKAIHRATTSYYHYHPSSRLQIKGNLLHDRGLRKTDNPAVRRIYSSLSVIITGQLQVYDIHRLVHKYYS